MLYCRKNEEAFHYIINRTYYLPVNIPQFIRLPLCIGENVDFCDWLYNIENTGNLIDKF